MDTSHEIVGRTHDVSPQDCNVPGNDPYGQSSYTFLKKARYQRDQRKLKNPSYSILTEAAQKVHCP